MMFFLLKKTWKHVKGMNMKRFVDCKWPAGLRILDLSRILAGDLGLGLASKMSKTSKRSDLLQDPPQPCWWPTWVQRSSRWKLPNQVTTPDAATSACNADSIRQLWLWGFTQMTWGYAPPFLQKAPKEVGVATAKCRCSSMFLSVHLETTPKIRFWLPSPPEIYLLASLHISASFTLESLRQLGKCLHIGFVAGFRCGCLFLQLQSEQIQRGSRFQDQRRTGLSLSLIMLIRWSCNGYVTGY